MAKTSKTLVKDTKLSGDVLDNEVLEILLGILLLLCGVLLIVPSFLKGINAKYVKWSMVAILVVWVLTIVMTDFVDGLKGVNGDEWIGWIEDLVTHLLVLACVFRVSKDAF